MDLFGNYIMRNEEEIIKELIAKLACDCSILEIKDFQELMSKYHQALAEGKKEDYTPLFILPPREALGDVELSSEERKGILEKAKDIDAKTLLNQLYERNMVFHDMSFEEVDEFEENQEQEEGFAGIGLNVGRKVILAKIPTDKPWELAAWIPMGGYNECPESEEQVAIFKYWYEKYGAIPGFVSHDIWEFYVEKPPKSQEEAEELAREQFAFCGDIVWQGTGTVKQLTGTLLSARYWFFWWD